MASLRDIFNNRIKKPISSILANSARGYNIGFNNLKGNVQAITNPQTRQDWFRGSPVTNAAYNVATTFAKPAQTLGQALGTAIVAPMNNLYLKRNAEIDQRLANTLRQRQQAQFKSGQLDASRNTSNLLSGILNRSADRQIGFGQQLERARESAASGTLGTSLQLFGAKGITPGAIAGYGGGAGVLGGVINKYMIPGGSFSEGFGQGAGGALQNRAVNKLTQPYIEKLGRLFDPKIAKNLSKKQLRNIATKKFLTGIGVNAGANILEDEILTRGSEGRGQTADERWTSGLIGGAIGAATNLPKADAFKVTGQMRDAFGKWTKQAVQKIKGLADLSPKLRKQILESEFLRTRQNPQWVKTPTGLKKVYGNQEAYGAIAGLEPEYDEEGKLIGVKYNPEKGLIGVAGLIGGKKALKYVAKSRIGEATSSIPRPISRLLSKILPTNSSVQSQSIPSTVYLKTVGQMLPETKLKTGELAYTKSVPLNNNLEQIGGGADSLKMPTTSSPVATGKQFLESLGESPVSRVSQPNVSSNTIVPQPRKSVAESFGRDPNLTENKKLSDLFNQTSTPDNIRVDEEARAQGLGNLLDENAQVNTQVKNTFGDWVKARQASRVQDSIKKRQFSQFDAEDINGINRFQSGEKAGLESVTKYFDDKFNELQKAGVKFNYQEDYVPQLWKNSPGEVSDVLGKRVGLKPSFTLDKVIEDYKTGIKLGLTPKFTKLSELVGWYEGRANKALADTQFFNSLVKDELIKPSSQAKGWITLDPDRFPKFKSGYEGTEYQGTYSAPKELADLVNNYLKQPEGTVANIANYASKVKNTLLSAGIPGTGLNAHGLNILARNTMASNNPVGGFLRGTQYLVNPKSAEKYINTNLDKVEFAAKSGVTFNIEDHNFGSIEDTIVKENQNVLSKVWGAAMERREKLFDKPLFEKAIPALKVQYFDDLYTSLSKEVNEKDAARTASEITNNIFGGINSEAMGRSRETQNIFRSLILAPDWAETQLRLGKNIPKSIIDFKNPAGKAYRTFARNMVLAFTAMAAANKATSGHYPWENEAGHTFEIEAGTTEDGKKRYIRPLGTALDFVRLPYDVAASIAKGDMSSIGRVVRNRLSVPLSNAAEIVLNVDYRGRKVFGSDVPVQQQLGSIASIASESVGVPSQFSSIMGGLTGKTGAEETLTNLIEAPFRYTGGASSKTQKYVQDILKDSSLSGKEKYDLYAKLKGQTLGDKQKRAIELGGTSALNTILKQKELNKKQTDLRKKYSGEEEEKGLLEDLFPGLQAKKVGASDNPTDTTTSAALLAGVPTTTPASSRGGLRSIFDKLTGGNKPAPEVVPTIKPGELKNLSKFESDDIKLRQEFGEPVTNDELTSYYLGDIPSSKSKSAYDTTVRQKALFKALERIEDDEMLSEEQRQVLRDRIATETGLEQKDLDYYQVAQQDSELKYQKVLDDAASLESRDELYKYLSENRKVINGKLVASDEVIDQLYEDGYLEDPERDYLKALRWDQKKKKAYLDRDFKAKGSGTGKKKLAAYFNALEGVQKAQGQLQTASRIQPISLGRSNLETVLSQSRAGISNKSRTLESIFSQLEASKKKLRNLKY